MKKKHRTFGFSLPLSQVSKNRYVQIRSIPNPTIRVQAMRLGMTEGSYIFCLEKLPHGPVIILVENQQVAIGYSLAKQIKTIPVNLPFSKTGGSL